MSPLKTFQASYSYNKKQGIVAVLSSDSDHSQFQPSSLRRTLSADMSSHKWISHMKKVSSFQELQNPKTEHQTEDETEGHDVWSSIVEDSRRDSNIMSDPYVHPLLKRSGKCLSEKSLEICTESLGSETGSDGFSSYPSSENGDSDEEEEENIVLEGNQIFEMENQWKTVKISYKKSIPRRSFPPPLPTLSGPDGESLRMQPRRDNGRLVLEALSVPSTNNFRAQRQDGRLVLTLVNRNPINQVVKNDDTEEDQEEKEEKVPKMAKSLEFPSGLVNTHRLTSMMMSKTIVLANRNPSLPPRPKTAQPIIGCVTPPVAVSLNAYEYYWRSKSMGKAGTTVNPLGQQPAASFKSSSRKVMICKNRTTNEEEKLVVMCSNGSCKEVRRTAVFWEPHCIATS